MFCDRNVLAWNVQNEHLVEERERGEEEDGTQQEVRDPFLVPAVAFQVKQQIVEAPTHRERNDLSVTR